MGYASRPPDPSLGALPDLALRGDVYVFDSPSGIGKTFGALCLAADMPDVIDLIVTDA